VLELGFGGPRGEQEGQAATAGGSFLADSTTYRPEGDPMFEDQKVELLPERTTMVVVLSQNLNTAVAAAANAGNINIGGDQANVAMAEAAAGSNFISG
jgi:hypothetical protein